MLRKVSFKKDDFKNVNILTCDCGSKITDHKKHAQSKEHLEYVEKKVAIIIAQMSL